MIEVWKACPSWPRYEISDLGRVRRLFGTRILRKPYLSTTGYWFIVMRDDGRQKAVGIHRLIAEAFIGPAPSAEHHVAHGDGDKLNNDPQNLRWATRSENERDKVLHGRSNRGERQGRSKLTAEEVLRIRGRLAMGERNPDIAKDFGVASTTISSIANGHSWAWLGDEVARAA